MTTNHQHARAPRASRCRVADLVVDHLAATGIEYVFGVDGANIEDRYDAHFHREAIVAASGGALAVLLLPKDIQQAGIANDGGTSGLNHSRAQLGGPRLTQLQLSMEHPK
jgi:hypothetical protein